MKENSKPDINLVPAIREIEEIIRNLKSKHRKELEPYEQSLDALKNINTACLNCNGTGKVFHRACAEDEGDYYTCEECKGTGKQIK